MKKLSATAMMLVCMGASAAQQDTEAANSFSCMSAESFEIDAACMSTKIETSDSFLNAQTILFEQNANSAHAMATLSIDPKTLDIEVVAHKDAYLAKLLDQDK